MNILAKSGNHALLENNRIPVIGYTVETHYHNNGRSFKPIKLVCFHYGTENTDIFYFLEDKPLFNSLSLTTPDYLTLIYQDCIQKAVSPQTLIDKVTEAYTLTQMGF